MNVPANFLGFVDSLYMQVYGNVPPNHQLEDNEADTANTYLNNYSV